jgi:glycosyltransferase involved in cell wall biosynthesis
MSTRPLISIIVPSYNQGRFIGRTLNSILEQDYRPLEILVIDGASKDETVEVLKSFAHRPEVRWWSEKDSGVAEAVNKGITRAQGEIAGIQSSDDVYYPGAISLAAAAFARDPSVGMVYGESGAIDEEDRLLWRSNWAPYSLENFLLRITRVPQASAFFRTALARELDGWDDRYFVCDTELWLRMMFRTKVVKLDAMMSSARLHGVRRDHQKRKIWDSYWKMINESDDLGRAAPNLRRAAQAGAHALVLTHNPFNASWRVPYHCWRAVLAHPRGHLAVAPRSNLLPGGARLARWLGRGPAP